MKTKTTTKKFRDGIKLSPKGGDEIRWESTGHLSVRLLDASGTIPLTGRSLQVEIPDEGTLVFETDASGNVFHPDVPFQDYELDLGDGVKVHAPAVSNSGDVQERHVPKIAHAFVRLHIRDTDGLPRRQLSVTLRGPSGASCFLKTDDDGIAGEGQPVPEGEYQLDSDEGTATIALPDHADGLVIVQLNAKGGAA